MPPSPHKQRGLACPIGGLTLACPRAPQPIADSTLRLSWHQRDQADLAVQHVARTLEQSFRRDFASA